MTSASHAGGYRTLDDARIIETIHTLRARIEERFPGSGLGRVSGELLALAHEAKECVESLRRPHWPLRVGVALVIVTLLVIITTLAMTIQLPAGVDGMADFVQAIEAGVNDIVFLGIAIFFLLTAETRVKRRRALASLHQLRSVVHIVDMHQLTKDPERLLSGSPDTPSSPQRVMSPAQLGRYLDYCTELLSLASKLAALFVQHFNDPVVLAAVTEIEGLAGGLSGQIWQKIALLEGLPGTARAN